MSSRVATGTRWRISRSDHPASCRPPPMEEIATTANGTGQIRYDRRRRRPVNHGHISSWSALPKKPPEQRRTARKDEDRRAISRRRSLQTAGLQPRSPLSPSPAALGLSRRTSLGTARWRRGRGGAGRGTGFGPLIALEGAIEGALKRYEREGAILRLF